MIRVESSRRRVRIGAVGYLNARPLVFGLEDGNALGEDGGGVPLRGDDPEPEAAGAAFLGAGLKPDEGSQEGLAEAARDSLGPSGRQVQRHDREQNAGRERRRVTAGVRMVRLPQHGQTERTLLYFS